MTQRARLLKVEGNQAVLLPRELWFDGGEVLLSRDGHRVILESVEEPKTNWNQSFLDLAESAADFPYPDEALAREMEEGYRAEAEDPSLDPEWSGVEVEGL